MKRVLIFAAYSRNGAVCEDVQDLLRAFRPFADKILFVADNEFSETELQKLKKTADWVQCSHHGEYDFGSYKRGLAAAKEKGWLDGAEELIFCNDSCFGPCFPLQEMFAKMDKTDCDFWGIVESREIQPHVQSYFWAFREKLFTSDLFKNFMDGIEKLSSPREIISKYEVPATAFFRKNGFTVKTYIDWDGSLPPTACPVTLLQKRCPLIKRKVFQRTKYAKESVLKTLALIKKTNPKLYFQIKKTYGIKLYVLLLKRGAARLFSCKK